MRTVNLILVALFVAMFVASVGAFYALAVEDAPAWTVAVLSFVFSLN